MISDFERSGVQTTHKNVLMPEIGSYTKVTGQSMDTAATVNLRALCADEGLAYEHPTHLRASLRLHAVKVLPGS